MISKTVVALTAQTGESGLATQNPNSAQLVLEDGSDDSRSGMYRGGSGPSSSGGGSVHRTPSTDCGPHR